MLLCIIPVIIFFSYEIVLVMADIHNSSNRTETEHNKWYIENAMEKHIVAICHKVICKLNNIPRHSKSKNHMRKLYGILENVNLQLIPDYIWQNVPKIKNGRSKMAVLNRAKMKKSQQIPLI